VSVAFFTVILSVIMLIGAFIYCYAECHFPECGFTEWHIYCCYAECLHADYHKAALHFFIVMLSGLLHSVIFLSVPCIIVMLSVIKLIVIFLFLC
jgi:hypothetical protein